MEDGKLVFPLMAKNEAEDVYSMIVHSTDNGSNWTLCEGISPAKCHNPASPSGRDHFSWLLTSRMTRGCRSRVTWGQRGRRQSGNSQAYGSTHDRESLRRKTCVWMPSSPRPLRNGRSCRTLREGTPRGRKGPLRSASGSRTTTARFLLDRLAWTMLRISCSPAPCCTRMAICIFYKGGAVVRAVSFHFPA
ncbi:trans-sialidase [Trypanosoma cruzi]|nr:trans-sialidase [Trypanosoma cruzi]